MTKAFVYCRISTNERLQKLSLQAQFQACTAEIERRDWTFGEVFRDEASGKSLKRRPGLERALKRICPGDVLIVARLDRLSRSARDFYDLMDRANREGWSILCLDPMVDMTSPFGRALAGMAAVFAQLERELIGQRQRESIEARRALGLYREPASWLSAPESTTRRVRELALQGMGSGAIVRRLTLEGVRPPRAEVWHRRTVQLMVRRMREQGVLPPRGAVPSADPS